MAFSQTTINQVKQASAFRCCRCQSIGIEAHHIISQKDKGPDTFENAAPLCPTCHSWFGDNPMKRKEITQMRDWWYAKVKEMYAPQIMDFQLLNDINSKVEAIGVNQDKALEDLKVTLKEVAIETIEQMTAGTARITASGIANATVSPFPSISASPSASRPVYASPSSSRPLSEGGTGGEVFIFSRNLSGSGSISADGGSGYIGGDGGKVHIESDNNQFKGTVTAKGGESTKDKK